MSKNNLQRAKGVRDFLPQEKIARNKIVDLLQEVFELYGYNPIETPVLERYETFASKYGIGQESDAMQETFKLKDQGNRDLVLRTEFTVPFARFVGMNPQLKMPFKRYQMGSVFRDGPIKLGRYREFWQCDVDVVGIKKMTIDAEIINLTRKIFNKLDINIDIQLNSRKLLNDILLKAQINQDKQESIIVSIDKLDKIGSSGVGKELEEKGVTKKQIKTILDLINISGTNQEKIDFLEKELSQSEGLTEIKTIFALVDSRDMIFLPSLARGLAYYTGTIFEVFLKDKSKLSSSLAGGGRYDNMIGGFLEKKEQIPAIGISFGLETIFDALQIQKSNLVAESAISKAYISAIGNNLEKEALKLAEDLRNNSIRVDLDLQSKNLRKNLDYADSYGINWVIILGEDEIKQGKYTLRNMKTGQQQLLSLNDIIKELT